MQLPVQALQIAISLLLMLFILIQSKGVGLGSTFGGGGEVYHTRRGAEKVIFYLTIITSLIFVLSSIANVWLA